MSERWESESLRWIHEIREQNYKRTRGKLLRKLSLGPSREVQALARRLGLQRVPLRSEERQIPKRRSGSR